MSTISARTNGASIPLTLAFDGGAFQQGIAAGIYNVQIGLMNAISRARPEIGFLLVTDPRLGPVRETLLAPLAARPEIVEGEIGPAYGGPSRRILSGDPAIRFEVDGRLVPARLADGTAAYEGPAPRRSFRVLSRADSPAATQGSADTRTLGIAVSSVAIRAAADLLVLRFDDPDLSEGFHPAEAWQRWTDGAARIPVELFPPGADDVEVTVGVASTTAYRPGGGIFGDPFAEVIGRAESLALAAETARVEARLIGLGATAYVANHFIPARMPSLPTYAILYDLIPILHPEHFMGDARANFARNMTVFREAEHVFSISEASRSDLIEVGKVPPERVSAMMIDVDPRFRRRPDAEIAHVGRTYGIGHRPYILAVGTLEPRKNHRRLIEAFHALSRSGADPCDLVVVGQHGWGTGDLMTLVSVLGLEERVRFLTSVPTEDLAALYSGAMLCAYPSLYEGFGLPILEAMACGCPVLTSDRSSMPEIAREAAVLCDPTDTGSILRGLHALSSNAALRERLAALGLARRPAFSWDVSAERFLRVVDRG